MRQQQHQSRQQPPFIVAGGDERIDDDRRAIGEISKLRLPQYQRLGIVTAVAILKSQYASLRKDGIIYLIFCLFGRDVVQRNVLVFVLNIDQHAVTLVEGSALRILPTQAYRGALDQKGTKRYR